MRAILVMAVVCVSAGLARAEEAPATEAPTTKAPAKEPPTWSVGAGVGFSGLGYIGVSSIGCLGCGTGITVTAPQGNLFVERSLGAADWLVLSVNASYGSQTTPGQTLGSMTTQDRSDTSKRVGALLGVRHVLTTPRIVEASFWVGLAATWQRAETSYTNDPIGYLNYSNQYTAISGLAGLTFDRELVEGLSVRFNLGLIEATRAWGMARQYQAPDQEVSVTNLGFRVSPTLELRIAI